MTKLLGEPFLSCDWTRICCDFLLEVLKDTDVLMKLENAYHAALCIKNFIFAICYIDLILRA